MSISIKCKCLNCDSEFEVSIKNLTEKQDVEKKEKAIPKALKWTPDEARGGW